MVTTKDRECRDIHCKQEICKFYNKVCVIEEIYTHDDGYGTYSIEMSDKFNRCSFTANCFRKATNEERALSRLVE